MEVKPGYKQTEVGVIPEDWDVKALKQLSPRQSVGLVINPSTYFDKSGTVPLLVGSNVSANVIDSTTANRITVASNELLSASRLAAGDLVMVRVGEPGVAAVVPPELDGCNCASMMIVRKHPTFASRWLCCAMNSQHGRQQVEHVQYGTAQKQFNVSDAVDFLYPVPPLPEQRAIAAALSDVDALLGGLDRLIAKKRDLKQAAMQQLLTGQTRLPGFNSEWELSTVGAEFEVSLGKMLDAERNSGIPKPYVGNKAVQWGRIDLSELQTVPMSRADMRRYRLAKGDLLVCEGGEVGRAAIWDAPVKECYYQKALHRLRPLQGFNSQLMAALLKLWADRGALMNYVTQTSIAHLPREKFMEVPLPVPPIQEQVAIAAVLSDIDAELSVLEARRTKTRALKQAMMQALLTGRIRLV